MDQISKTTGSIFNYSAWLTHVTAPTKSNITRATRPRENYWHFINTIVLTYEYIFEENENDDGFRSLGQNYVQRFTLMLGGGFFFLFGTSNRFNFNRTRSLTVFRWVGRPSSSLRIISRQSHTIAETVSAAKCVDIGTRFYSSTHVCIEIQISKPILVLDKVLKQDLNIT